MTFFVKSYEKAKKVASNVVSNVQQRIAQHNSPEAREARRQAAIANLKHQAEVAKYRSQIRGSQLQHQPQRPKIAPRTFQRAISARPVQATTRQVVRYVKKGKHHARRVVRPSNRPIYAPQPPPRTPPASWEYKG